ncbi:hypothetical protein IFM47457_07314 [Aspergillus lentulus]|nr:hypothetical protein IFM47457_07314 [Aspergillus lentulus]
MDDGEGRIVISRVSSRNNRTRVQRMLLCECVMRGCRPAVGKGSMGRGCESVEAKGRGENRRSGDADADGVD